MNFNVEYNFYLKYIEDQNFKKKFNYRIEQIKKIYNLDLTLSETIKEYFVEIFSWSVLPYELLKIIDQEIKKYNLKLLIDPSCGSAFHGYLFQQFCKLNTVNLDLQNESFSWLPIIQGDGRHYLKLLKIEQHYQSVLLLSWIDYQDLCLDFLNLFQGKMVISLGNYDKLCPKYKKVLNDKYDLITKITLQMPWDLKEGVELYVKKN